MTPEFRKLLVKEMRQNLRRMTSDIREFAEGRDTALQAIAMASGNLQFASNWTHEWANERNLGDEYLLPDNAGDKRGA